jgi:uncharacterized protein YkwD
VLIALAVVAMMMSALVFLSILLPKGTAALVDNYNKHNNRDYVTVTAPEIRNHNNQKLERLAQGSLVNLPYLVKNNSPKNYHSTLVVEVRDSNQFTTDLQQHNSMLAKYSESRMNTSWVAGKKGEYEIRSFLVADLTSSSSAPKVLSFVNILKIYVAQNEVVAPTRVEPPKLIVKEVNNSGNIVYIASDSDTDAVAELKQHALQKINDDRAEFGLSPVSMSNNRAAQIHADDVLKTRTISHWMTNGEKPYMTYTRLGGDGKVTQNIGIAGYGDHYDDCVSGAYVCNKLDPYEQIDNTEYIMMYNDEDCCKDGHRENILDKFHTNVSIGIAYNDYFFVMVQNFENQYTVWADRINDNNNDDDNNDDEDSSHTDNSVINMAGSFTNNADDNPDDHLSLENVQVYYDSTPTPEIYEEHKHDESYGPGEFIGLVVKPPPSGMFYRTPSNFGLVEAQTWDVTTSKFRINFSLENLFNKYGSGVYTIVILAKDSEGEVLATSETSVFLD